VGNCLSAEVAVGGFHSKAGWLGFNVVALGLVMLARQNAFLRCDVATSVDAEPEAGPRREAVFLAPLMAIVATAMITGAFSAGGLDLYYPIRLTAVAVPLWWYRREYVRMRWACSWQALALGLLVFAIWVARWPAESGTDVSRSTLTLSPSFGWWSAWLLARVVGSVVTVPLAEELAFRGFLLRRLIAKDFDTVPPGRFTWISFVLSSVAFGVLHDRWLEGTIAGMVYALAYYRRGSLGDAIGAHATTNALLSAEALATGNWALFS
jgi:exosortase E/protease (VPEID-CTERM system)